MEDSCHDEIYSNLQAVSYIRLAEQYQQLLVSIKELQPDNQMFHQLMISVNIIDDYLDSYIQKSLSLIQQLLVEYKMIEEQLQHGRQNDKIFKAHAIVSELSIKTSNLKQAISQQMQKNTQINTDIDNSKKTVNILTHQIENCQDETNLAIEQINLIKRSIQELIDKNSFLQTQLDKTYQESEKLDRINNQIECFNDLFQQIALNWNIKTHETQFNFIETIYKKIVPQSGDNIYLIECLHQFSANERQKHIFYLQVAQQRLQITIISCVYKKRSPLSQYNDFFYNSIVQPISELCALQLNQYQGGIAANRFIKTTTIQQLLHLYAEIYNKPSFLLQGGVVDFNNTINLLGNDSKLIFCFPNVKISLILLIIEEFVAKIIFSDITQQHMVDLFISIASQILTINPESIQLKQLSVASFSSVMNQLSGFADIITDYQYGEYLECQFNDLYQIKLQANMIVGDVIKTIFTALIQKIQLVNEQSLVEKLGQKQKIQQTQYLDIEKIKSELVSKKNQLKFNAEENKLEIQLQEVSRTLLEYPMITNVKQQDISQQQVNFIVGQFGLVLNRQNSNNSLHLLQFINRVEKTCKNQRETLPFYRSKQFVTPKLKESFIEVLLKHIQ